jgi:hypothetical protein
VHAESDLSEGFAPCADVPSCVISELQACDVSRRELGAIAGSGLGLALPSTAATRTSIN